MKHFTGGGQVNYGFTKYCKTDIFRIASEDRHCRIATVLRIGLRGIYRTYVLVGLGFAQILGDFRGDLHRFCTDIGGVVRSLFERLF